MTKSKPKKPANRRPPSLQGEVKPFSLKRGQVCPQVSSQGRFRSSRGVVSTPNPAKNGYRSVGIFGSIYQLYVLMARVFLGKAPSPQHTVDHIDGDTNHDKIPNLRWATPQEQIQNSYATNSERRSSAGKLSKPIKGRLVIQNEQHQAAWRHFNSSHDAARELGIKQGNISACCGGKQEKAMDDKKRWWTFCYDKEAAEPDLLEGEEWRDVVMAH